MSYITKYGTLYGALPVTTGRIFWVAASASYTIDGRTYTAQYGNDGLSPERAVLTVSRALVLVTDAADDLIVLLPGAHSVTASLAFSKARVTLWGLQHGKGNWVRPRASLTISTDDELINVTAADVEIANIRLIPITTEAAIDFTGAADRLYVHDNSFDMATAAANTGTEGVAAVAATSAPEHLVIEHNYFECDAAQGAAVAIGDAQDFVVERNTFALRAGTWAAAITQAGVLGWGVIRDNDFLATQGATMTVGILGTDITSASSTGILRNFFGDDVSTPIDTYGAGDAYIAENYLASVGVASGGVLWSSTT